MEVLSADDPNRDRIEKFQEYESEGVPECWIVEGRDGRSGIWLYVRGQDGKYAQAAPDEDGRLHSTVLPGFWLDPAWLAADPLPKVLDCFRALAPEAFGQPAPSASSPNGS
jgi:Uma2 family endonuclease